MRFFLLLGAVGPPPAYSRECMYEWVGGGRGVLALVCVHVSSVGVVALCVIVVYLGMWQSGYVG